MSAHTSPVTHDLPPAPPDPRRWRALALLGIAQFMLVLDVTVVAIALPDIGADLGLDRTALTWVLSSYTLMFGGLLLLGGRLADVAGARRVVLVGLAVFTTASLVTGVAWNAETLIGGRVAQGVGAALLSPAALSIVATTFHGTERNRALGVWAALGGSGAAVGVLVGGVLTAGPGWPWVFYVNVPIGLAVLALLARVLPKVPPATATARASRLDLPGAALVTAGTGAAIYGLINAGDDGWTAAWTLGPLAGALVTYAAFAVLQARLRAPLMDLWILTRRPVVAGVLLMLVATGLLISSFFLGSFYLQHERGYGPLTTGLLFLPVALATIAGAQAGGHAVGRAGPRPVAVVALAVAAAGAALPAAWPGTATLVAGISIAAAGVGATFVTATTSALAHVDRHDAGLASGIVNTFHEFGAAIGVAVASSIAAANITTAAVDTSGFTNAFTFSAVAAATAAVLALVLVPPGRPPASAVPHLH